MGSIRKGRTAQAPTTSHVGQTLAMGGGGGAYLPSPAPSLPGEPALPPSPSPPPPSPSRPRTFLVGDCGKMTDLY